MQTLFWARTSLRSKIQLANALIQRLSEIHLFVLICQRSEFLAAHVNSNV